MPIRTKQFLLCLKRKEEIKHIVQGNFFRLWRYCSQDLRRENLHSRLRPGWHSDLYVVHRQTRGSLQIAGDEGNLFFGRKMLV